MLLLVIYLLLLFFVRRRSDRIIIRGGRFNSHGQATGFNGKNQIVAVWIWTSSLGFTEQENLRLRHADSSVVEEFPCVRPQGRIFIEPAVGILFLHNSHNIVKCTRVSKVVYTNKYNKYRPYRRFFVWLWSFILVLPASRTS